MQRKKKRDRELRIREKVYKVWVKCRMKNAFWQSMSRSMNNGLNGEIYNQKQNQHETYMQEWIFKNRKKNTYRVNCNTAALG